MKQTLEKKVYSPWAYTENEEDKCKINYELYEELKDKAQVVGKASGYAHFVAMVVPTDKEHFKFLEDDSIHHNDERKKSLDELALIADNGNLCFGYYYLGKLSSYTNWQGEKFENVYRFSINTD